MNIILFTDKINSANTYSLIAHAHVRVGVIQLRLVSIGIYYKYSTLPRGISVYIAPKVGISQGLGLNI